MRLIKILNNCNKMKLEVALRVLGIPQNDYRKNKITAERIKKIYHKKAFESHPDRNGQDSTKLFQEVQEAYDVICEDLMKNAQKGTLRDIIEQLYSVFFSTSTSPKTPSNVVRDNQINVMISFADIWFCRIKRIVYRINSYRGIEKERVVLIPTIYRHLRFPHRGDWQPHQHQHNHLVVNCNLSWHGDPDTEMFRIPTLYDKRDILFEYGIMLREMEEITRSPQNITICLKECGETIFVWNIHTKPGIFTYHIMNQGVPWKGKRGNLWIYLYPHPDVKTPSLLTDSVSISDFTPCTPIARSIRSFLAVDRTDESSIWEFQPVAD